MTLTPYTLSIRLLLLSFVFFLSSCADHKIVSSLPEPILTQIAETTEAVDTDLQFIETEEKICLDEELVELSKTGTWNEGMFPVSSQTVDTVVYDFPVVYNKQVQMYLDLFQTKQRKTFGRWLGRAATYRPMMERELAEAGLPLDLVYLAMIESGFNQLAYSRARAVGLWQFMKGTGKQYNLKIDKYVDERRDAVKSTKAAIAYLSDLYKDFGDWHLAVASYNAGPGKMRRGLKKYKVDNFWDLASKKYLRLETKRYVPKLIAALIIANDPEKYGFTTISPQPPLEFDTIKVGPGMSLDAIALISDSNTKEIKHLNRELRQTRTPLNVAHYEVKIPSASAEIAGKNISRLHSIVTTGYKSHKIRKNETLTKICRKYGINKTTVLKVNNLRNGKLLTGKNLRIPYSTVTYQLLPEGSNGAMAAYKDSLVLHRIKPGDTVSKIANKYNVPPGMVVEWNGLKSVHAIRAGQQLALYINGGKKLYGGKKSQTDSVRIASADHILLRADKKKKRAKDIDPFHLYRVRNGDSLWTISRKFRTSTADIKKWNNLKSNLIHPGSKLKLKKV